MTSLARESRRSALRGDRATKTTSGLAVANVLVRRHQPADQREDQAVPAAAESEDHPEGIPSPVSLTEDNPAEEKRSKITPVGLPVRTPGVSFRDSDETATSSSASRSGAIGIKSALTDFNDGRTLANQKLEAREDDTDEDDGRDQ
jgi:hypothetical protein